MARLFKLLLAASGARGACGGFGFALNDGTGFDFTPASHEIPLPPRFLILNSRSPGIVVWHGNTKNGLIGRQVWVGLDLV